MTSPAKRAEIEAKKALAALEREREREGGAALSVDMQEVIRDRLGAAQDMIELAESTGLKTTRAQKILERATQNIKDAGIDL